MYADFIKELKKVVDFKNTSAQIDLPYINLEGICQGIRIFGIDPEIITVKYDFKSEIYEVSCNYKSSITVMSSKDINEVVKYIKEEFDSEILKKVMSEVDLLIGNGEI